MLKRLIHASIARRIDEQSTVRILREQTVEGKHEGDNAFDSQLNVVDPVYPPAIPEAGGQL